MRRRFRFGVNLDLVATLLAGVGTGEISDLRFAVDERRLHRESDHVSWIEKDYWSGPRLLEASLDSQVGKFPNVTVHGRPVGTDVVPGDLYDRFTARWSLGPDPWEKTIELEELVDPATIAGQPLVLVRFLHAIRATRSHTFRHTDGAIRAYTPDAYKHRRDTQFVTAGQGLVTHYRKVFRADGVIQTTRWSNIVARWFRNNELAGEYLATLG